MTKSRREKLVGSVVSLPTFTDDDHNLRLDRERKHIRWLIDNGIKEGTGVLLIAGATVIPPVSARMLTDSFRTMLILSTALGAVCGFVGIYLSYFVDVSSGASIVLVEAIVFALALGYSNLRPQRAASKQRVSAAAPTAQPNPSELD